MTLLIRATSDSEVSVDRRGIREDPLAEPPRAASAVGVRRDSDTPEEAPEAIVLLKLGVAPDIACQTRRAQILNDQVSHRPTLVDQVVGVVDGSVLTLALEVR